MKTPALSLQTESSHNLVFMPQDGYILVLEGSLVAVPQLVGGRLGTLACEGSK